MIRIAVAVAPIVYRASQVVQRAGPAAARIAPAAQSSANALRYALQLARAQQLQNAVVIAGRGSAFKINDITRLVSQYGGRAGDWSKMVGRTVYRASNGLNYQLHWYARRMPNGSVDFRGEVGHIGAWVNAR